MSRNFYDGSTSNYYCPSINSSNSGSGSDVPQFIINSNGNSIVTKIRIYASSSSLSIGSGAKGDYDPTSFTLEGLNPNTNIYQPIISSKSFNQEWVDRIPQRNIPNIQINSSYDSGDDNLIYTEVTFDNLDMYSSYRLMFPSTRVYPNSDDSTYAVEVGGVELVGQLVPENANGEPTQVRYL